MANEPDNRVRAVFGGLGTAELDACQALLSDLGAELTFDAGGIFAGLREGHSLEQALGLPEETADIIYSQAIAHFNAGDISSAIPLFQALTFLKPDVRDHWLGLGICARVQSQWDTAALAFQTAASLDPDGAAPMFHLCELYCQKEDWPKARSELQRFEKNEETGEKRRLGEEMRRLKNLIEMRNG